MKQPEAQAIPVQISLAPQLVPAARFVQEDVAVAGWHV
jgi:hypothetical protein